MQLLVYSHLLAGIKVTHGYLRIFSFKRFCAEGLEKAQHRCCQWCSPSLCPAGAPFLSPVVLPRSSDSEGLLFRGGHLACRRRGILARLGVVGGAPSSPGFAVNQCQIVFIQPVVSRVRSCRCLEKGMLLVLC